MDSTSIMTERNELLDSSRDRGHEATDIKIRAVLGAAAILIAVLIISHLFLLDLFETLTREAAPPEPTPFPFEEFPPGPRLQPNPAQDLQALRQAEEVILSSYGWVEHQAGVVRIPIERAMDLLIEQGHTLKPREKADIRQLIQERPP